MRVSLWVAAEKLRESRKAESEVYLDREEWVSKALKQLFGEGCISEMEGLQVISKVPMDWVSDDINLLVPWLSLVIFVSPDTDENVDDWLI